MRTVTRPRVSPGRRVTARDRHNGFSGFGDTRLTRPTAECLGHAPVQPPQEGGEDVGNETQMNEP